MDRDKLGFYEYNLNRLMRTALLALEKANAEDRTDNDVRLLKYSFGELRNFQKRYMREYARG